MIPEKPRIAKIENEWFHNYGKLRLFPGKLRLLPGKLRLLKQ